jgi:hypothetical protein
MTKARDIASAAPAPSTVSPTELGYLDGVTSAVQTQIDAKIAKSIVTTKGDILVATGSGTIVRQGIGSNGQVLTADSAETDGIKWAAPAAGGKVLQVVSSNQVLSASTTSSTFSDTGLTVSITPTSSTSKIYVTASLAGAYARMSTSAITVIGGFRLLRDSTVIHDPQYVGVEYFPSSTNKLIYGSIAFTITDSPATTSALTYKVQFNEATGSSVTSAVGSGYITVMEIGA